MSKYDYKLDLDDSGSTSTAIYEAAAAGGRRVLDIGSGAGIIGAELTRGAAKEVTCLDLDAEALDEARGAGIHETHVTDLRATEWYAPVAGGRFDVVILADVLEHLVDPERILADILAHDIVDPGGRLVVSIPNAGHEAVVAELATGNFRYVDSGLLDRTHVRFFTLKSVTDMLEAGGFFVAGTRRTQLPLSRTRQRHRAPDIGPELRAALDAMGPDGQTFQFVLTVRPAVEAARLADLGEQLEQARTRIHAADVKRVEAEHAAAHDRDLAERHLAAAEAARTQASADRQRVEELAAQVSLLTREVKERDAWRPRSMFRRRVAALRSNPDYRRNVVRRLTFRAPR